MWITLLVLTLAQAPETTTAVPQERAQELYTANCQSCHGPAGKGSPIIKGSAFVKRTWKHGTREEDMVKTITDGVPGTMMLPFKERLKPEEIAALASLVRSFDKTLKPAGVKK
jgi:mono/diheme cytochrome c family protein